MKKIVCVFISTVLLTVLLAGTINPDVPSAAQNNTKVRLALVGAWHVHTKMFIEKIAKQSAGKVEWVAVWDHDAERGNKYAEMLGVPYESDYQNILDNENIDAVMIEAETNLHKDLIIRAANAKKHVFTDKVITTTVKDGLSVKKAVEENGVKLVVSHESLPIGSYQYAKKLVDEGSLGDIVAINFRRAHGMAKTNNLPETWYDKDVAGGGALIDLGVHGMSMLTYLAGTPTKVSSFMENWTDREVEDSATIMLEFENNAIGTAHTNMVTSIMENSLEVIGTDGILVVLGVEGRESVYLNSKHISGMETGMNLIEPTVYGSDGSVPINLFIDFVLDESNKDQYLPGFDIDTALTVVGIAEAAYKSAKTGGSAVKFKKSW
ncbi:putative dehydrogenase [Bacillus niacini]|uniref:Dehydrogenase n=1 Tax=Neobacillus niacini TaxID=86668 RepID=A0A852T6U6_9BACI|nr:Gfo/Idh/MocA family oxidoreductase [Neobacillus niacini]NYE04480.1 putative dehydrogenase [Neobacillus niacini]